ncbi:MAG: glycosyltransferase [Bacteroidetes bacterium]|nr:glycosyltransferase [Bacteroidota bacterium]
MNFLFSSVLCSKRMLSYLQEKAQIKPSYSVQKFCRLIAVGLIKNGSKVSTISSVPFTRKSIKRLVFNVKAEFEDHIEYHYAFSINVPLIKNLCVFLYSFFFTLFWCVKNKKGVVICDVLQVSTCIGSLLATKIANRICVGVVTDMPGYSVNKGASSIVSKVMMLYINSFDKYILLTEEMNELINKKKRSYIIMEGLVDSEMISGERIIKSEKKEFIYAGGLYEKYGVKMLIDAFIKLKNNTTELHLYGKGDLVNYIQKKSQEHKNIRYHGVVPNKEVVQAELKAFLLINPRFTSEKLTRYSFPSKNMEYMVSGTPVLTTNLSGMPEKYKKYVYLIEDETEDGLKNTFERILNLPEKDVIMRGLLAKEFVLQKKNNVIQMKKIIDFINRNE